MKLLRSVGIDKNRRISPIYLTLKIKMRIPQKNYEVGYCDLLRRGFDVDVGIVEKNVVTDEGKKIRKQLEVDFVVCSDSRFF